MLKNSRKKADFSPSFSPSFSVFKSGFAKILFKRRSVLPKNGIKNEHF